MFTNHRNLYLLFAWMGGTRSWCVHIKFYLQWNSFWKIRTLNHCAADIFDIFECSTNIFRSVENESQSINQTALNYAIWIVPTVGSKSKINWMLIWCMKNSVFLELEIDIISTYIVNKFYAIKLIEITWICAN